MIEILPRVAVAAVRAVATRRSRADDDRITVVDEISEQHRKEVEVVYTPIILHGLFHHQNQQCSFAEIAGCRFDLESQPVSAEYDCLPGRPSLIPPGGTSMTRSGTGLRTTQAGRS